MTTVTSIALGGLQRSTRALETAAQNIANIDTNGYRAQRYDPSTDTTTSAARSSDTARDSGDGASSDVDLSTELVEMKRSEVSYDANAAVVRAADRMQGELLDLVA